MDMKKKFTEDEARLYMAEIIIGLEFLHENKIIYRDLKPENLVLDEDGHVKLTDFGLSKENVSEIDQANSFVGSICYLPPEVLNKTGHTRSIDWYLCGVLLYEMIVGIPPYYNQNRRELFKNILYGKLKIPKEVSEPAKKLISALMERNPKKRLGAGPTDAEELKKHKFF